MLEKYNPIVFLSVTLSLMQKQTSDHFDLPEKEGKKIDFFILARKLGSVRNQNKTLVFTQSNSYFESLALWNERIKRKTLSELYFHSKKNRSFTSLVHL